MASQVTSAVLLLMGCFAVLIVVSAAVGESQQSVPLMRPLHKEMKGMRPTLKNMKVTEGLMPKVLTQMAPKLEMPPMPGMPPMPDMPPMPAPPPSSSNFTYPSLAVLFLALVAVFCA